MENRDIDIAHMCHEETKRTYDSVYRSHHFLDWENQPRPYKQYTTLRGGDLPTLSRPPRRCWHRSLMCSYRRAAP